MSGSFQEYVALGSRTGQAADFVVTGGVSILSKIVLLVLIEVNGVESQRGDREYAGNRERELGRWNENRWHAPSV